MNYTWRPADGTDIDDIVALAETHFQQEIDQIFKPEPKTYSRNMTFAVVNQYYLPHTELVSVARDENNSLMAYTWAKRGERACWSDDEMVVVRMAHVNLKLSARERVRLVSDMMDLWERFTLFCDVPILCSTTMRGDQSAFLKMHSKRGYSVRGSFAYKKLSAV
tara:strand:- start:2849 stop:3340 length:492 start_codon:yes stop_codon:yes gene_type:complete